MADDLRPATMQDVITAIAQEHKIPPELALAIAKKESNFDPSAVSPKGAIGVMQLMPDTAKMLGVDPADPLQNITGGIKYLRQLSDQYGGNVEKILLAYNGGPGWVDKGTPSPDAQAYSADILSTLSGTLRKRSTGGTTLPQKGQSPAGAERGTPPTTEAPASPLVQRLMELRNVPADVAIGLAKKAGARITEAGAVIRKKVPALDVGPSVTFPTEPTNTAQRVGAAIEPIAEFALPGGAISKAAKVIPAATTAARLGVMAGEAVAQAGAGYGVAKSQGASEGEARLSGGLGAVGPVVGEVLPRVAAGIRSRAETQLARTFAKGLAESKSPITDYAVKTGDIADDQTRRAVDIVRRAASETLDAPVQLSWGKWMTGLAKDAKRKGETLGRAIEGALGLEKVPKQPIIDALDELESTSAKHFAQLQSGDYGYVTYDPPLQREIDVLRDKLSQYGEQMTVKNLVDLKRTWDSYVYTLSTAGKVGATPETLLATAQKEALFKGANAIRQVLKEEAPTIAALDEATSHAYQLQDLVNKLYKVNPAMGEKARIATKMAGAGTGFGVGMMVGHPYMGVGAGTTVGVLLAKALESPAWQTASPAIKSKLADALARGNVDAVRQIVAPLLQREVSK